ncbi:unannotated protein [freshwater metagenome]|uniref:Unannotated protein n=1 Tax=freshwater metagenome TaxID=449393 RepID=A0A6J7E3E1_9ZZZZ
MTARTATLSSVNATEPHRRSLEALCGNSALGYASSAAGRQKPGCVVTAASDSRHFALVMMSTAVSQSFPDDIASQILLGSATDALLQTALAEGGLFVLEADDRVTAWSGCFRSPRLTIATADGNVFDMTANEGHSEIRRESLSRGDRIVLISDSQPSLIPEPWDAIEMATCDNPSPTSACSWLLDAADEALIPSDRFVALWRVNP